MTNDFFNRLNKYFEEVANVLKGKAGVTSIFPNSTDKGMAREDIYKEFLSQHLPLKCNVFSGGFIFGNDGQESRQLDIIITSDTTPKFNFYQGKSFAPIEGTLGVISVKSMLDKNGLESALHEIASIPITPPLKPGSLNPLIPQISLYKDWPYKVIYSSDGIEAKTLLDHLNNFYKLNSNIPLFRRPNLIHVLDKYFIQRINDEITSNNGNLKKGDFYLDRHQNPDMSALGCVIHQLQHYASVSNQIFYNYLDLIVKLRSV